jgi:iron complex transport system permease protein
MTRPALTFTLATFALLILALLGLSIGRYPIDLFNPLDATAQDVLLRIRAPRVMAAILVGAALSAAGAAYQQLFRNPLVSPDILGVSAGAALGAVLGIFLSKDVVTIQAMAFLGGISTVAVVYWIGNAVRGHDPLLTLVLAGVLVGALAGAGVGLLKYTADPYNQLPAITFWLLGSLAGIVPADLVSTLPAVLIGLLPLWLLRWQIDTLALGDEEARALGVAVRPVRLAVIAGATLITAAVVAVAGIIGWVGLLVPHMARLLVGPRFALLLPATLLLGAAYMLAVDTLARGAVAIEIPLGILTALLGTPVFLWVLLKARRSWQ